MVLSGADVVSHASIDSKRSIKSCRRYICSIERACRHHAPGPNGPHPPPVAPHGPHEGSLMVPILLRVPPDGIGGLRGLGEPLGGLWCRVVIIRVLENSSTLLENPARTLRPQSCIHLPTNITTPNHILLPKSYPIRVRGVKGKSSSPRNVRAQHHQTAN